MKTLNTIQTLSKTGKIMSKIVYICCIVGFCGCIVGIAAVAICGTGLNELLLSETGSGIGTLLAAISVGMILCIGEFFISRMAYRYFENELKAGTPFTFDGAKELQHLGVSVIWISAVTAVMAEVAQSVIYQLMYDVERLSPEAFDSIALGLVFIFISLICKYGAEVKDKSENQPQ